jgi:hypothetical protein
MDTTNIYKKFRSIEKLASHYTLSKRFDEPTYFSFRLQFAPEHDKLYNYAGSGSLYDTMPHPLFDNIHDIIKVKSIIDEKLVEEETTQYSALQYLSDANEPTRAEMLKEFIQKFNDLQDNYPYYFQSIDGISDLLKIDPTKGQRISNEKKITITCLEGLDLRMSYLMNLYRKIVWDDIYQRWILPDMMRYFTLKIYLAEFRTFHVPQKMTGYGTAVTEKTSELKTINNTIPVVETTTPLYLSILDDILPVWEITCEMCEFDITDITFEHLNGLTVAGDPHPGAIQFGIKVGNIKELQIYPIFQHMFLIDKKLNGTNRAQDEISTLNDASNKPLYIPKLHVAQARELSSEGHTSGLPFNENSNLNNMYGQRGPGVDNKWGSDDAVEVNPTEPETWIGNAINFGTAYAKNFVNKIVDKAKITSVPMLGVSFSEVTAALAAKDIIGALGMIRKGINEVTNQYNNAPSSRLEEPIQTDNIMKEFLFNLSKSEATDKDTTTLIEAANIALSEKGIWEKIKDYSLATDLIGNGEVNIKKKLEGAEQYQSIVDMQSSKSSISVNSLDLNTGLSRIDPNAVSLGTINQEPMMIRGVASNNLSGEISKNAIKSGTASSNLSSKTETSGMNQGKASDHLISKTESSGVNQGEASKQLSSQIETSGINRGESSERLTSTTETSGIKRGKASEYLTSDVQTSGIKRGKASEQLALKTEASGVNQEKASNLLSSQTETSGIKQGKASEQLASNVQTSEISQGKASNDLSGYIENSIAQPKSSNDLSSKIQSDIKIQKPTSKIDEPLEKTPVIKMELPNVRTTVISLTKIIEAEPTSSMNKKINEETVEQPKVSKATNQNLFSK